MATYYETVVADRREKQRADPFVDLSTQIIVPLSNFVEDEDDALATRAVLAQWDSGTPFWGKYPGAYETVRFAKSLSLPGQCKLSGKGFEQRLQKDKPPGVHGHSVKQIGIQPAKVEILCRMWTEKHLEDFEKLIPLLLSQRYKLVPDTKSNILGEAGLTQGLGGIGFLEVSDRVRNRQAVTGTKSVAAGPKAIDIYHPLLALFKIRSVHVLSVGIPTPSSDHGVWEVKIDCEQFIYRPVAVKVANTSLEITELNLGKTAATLEAEKKKPSGVTADPNAGGTRGAL